MRKKHRIFIAVTLPAETQRELGSFEATWPELPATWIPRENLHVTLVYLGDLTEVEIGQVCMAVKKVAEEHHPCTLQLQKIAYGPEQKLPPRMLWAIGEKSRELSSLSRGLRDALLREIRFVADRKTFTPHVTLAKIGASAWRGMDQEELPLLPHAIDMRVWVESIEVMESELKRGGAAHTVIESFLLGPKI